MDDRRFDDMSRLIGAGGSRRRLLRLIVGSALAVPGLGSRRGASRALGCLGEGQPCVSTSDCCDDGIDELTCVDAVCAQPTCTGEMEDCGRYGPCCSGACVGEGALVCVTITCDDIGDCPTNATGCIAGVCIRGTCDVDFFCPAGLTCVDGRCVEPCADLSAACGDGGPACCGDLSCVEGVCAEQVTCAPRGASCMADVDCCYGLTCADGACRPPSPATPTPSSHRRSPLATPPRYPTPASARTVGALPWGSCSRAGWRPCLPPGSCAPAGTPPTLRTCPPGSHRRCRGALQGHRHPWPR